MIDDPPGFRNGRREDKWDLRIADGTWSEIILITPEMEKAKNGVGNVADEIECEIAKLKFQGAVSRRLEDLRDQTNHAARHAYFEAWKVDSGAWRGVGARVAERAQHGT
jgi:hypothetical protein